ncbi:MAG TPA: AmmeMemoRadiSam system protein B, partial [Firmicutes bacterium]|nr:AmmeMemoRadiSam system protein B [Bacillota bacterium]
FYPGSAAQLRVDVDRMLDDAEDFGIGDRVVALVAPHAGYVYSGVTAALAYRQVRGCTYDVVIVIAPSHRDMFPGVSIKPDGAYATPLGDAKIHRDVAKAIIEQCPDAHADERGHRAEHAVEVQIPFIQQALGDVPIVPIVMLDRSWGVCERLARAIHEATAELRALVVASSDLYHGASVDECEATDDRTIDAAVHADPREFCEQLEDDTVQACGGGPIAVAKAFAALRGATDARVLGRTNSAEVSGSFTGYVVGYTAIAYSFTDEDLARADSNETPSSATLTPEQRATILSLAKCAVRAAVLENEPPALPTDPSLHGKDQGAFVTLRTGGRRGAGMLRGCIGRMAPSGSPLAEVIIEMARAAALQDSRFMPVEPPELDDITVEVSVLSPLRRVDSPDEVTPGVHGLLISGYGRRGVLLPQVATEYGWGREEFLNETCVKAGLPRNAWRSGNVTIEVFTADVFGDEIPIGRADTASES